MRLTISAVLLAVALVAVPLATADSFAVYVGYADNLRPSGFFPTPWCGSASVALCGVGGASLDAGAVRIQNTGAGAITIEGLSVVLNGGGGPTFSLWGGYIGAGFVLAPGQDAVFSQTVSYDFDTSDYGFLPNGIGIDGAHPLGGCTNPGALSAAQQALCISNRPQVLVTIGGTTYTLTDSGHILDTFGYDFVCCASDGNESINWNLIGSEAVRGGTEVPEPGTMALVGGGLVGLLRRKRII